VKSSGQGDDDVLAGGIMLPGAEVRGEYTVDVGCF
jgi:hypothetical protein